MSTLEKEKERENKCTWKFEYFPPVDKNKLVTPTRLLARAVE